MDEAALTRAHAEARAGVLDRQVNGFAPARDEVSEHLRVQALRDDDVRSRPCERERAEEPGDVEARADTGDLGRYALLPQLIEQRAAPAHREHTNVEATVAQSGCEDRNVAFGAASPELGADVEKPRRVQTAAELTQ